MQSDRSHVIWHPDHRGQKSMLPMIVAIFSMSLCPSSSAVCPPSCTVCTENVTQCRGLASIPAVPQTTKGLLLTDGIIPSIEKWTLANLTSLTLLELSNNGIRDIEEDSFHGLHSLTDLLLNQNQITSETIMESTFIGLSNLGRLHLHSNGIDQINGAWFSNMAELGTLDMGSNRITKLEAGTFTRSNLQNLQILDLSNNLIEYIARQALRGFPALSWLDLSRNRLSEMDNSFSHLSKLLVLNLSLNQWNCTCPLQELAVFLRNYIKNPDRTLTNSRGLVCEIAESAEVQTVLQLTDTNCASQYRNATVMGMKGSDRNYVRDVVLAGILCFAGAVCLTVTVATLLYNKRMKSRQTNGQAAGVEAGREREGAFQRVPRYRIREREGEAKPTASSINHPKLFQQGMANLNSRKASSQQRVHQQHLDFLHQARRQSSGEECFVCQRCRLVHTFRTIPSHRDMQRSSGFTQSVHSENSNYPWKAAIRGCHLGKGHSKSVPGTRNHRQSRAITHLQSQSKHYACSTLSNIQFQRSAITGTQPSHQLNHSPFPTKRIQNAQLSTRHDNCHQLLQHSNRLPTPANSKVGSKARGDPLIGIPERNVTVMLPGDLLVFANHKRTFANQDRFGKEEESSDKSESRNYRDSRLIDHIEIFGTVWKGDRARRLKSVTFDLPDFADQKLTHHPEAGFKREEGGAGGAVTLKHLVKGGRAKVKEKSLLRSFPSQVQSSESRKRLGMTLFSADSKASRAVSHRPSVNVWMVKFILHPTKLAKVHPDEAARVKGLLRMKKQRTTKKTEWKETCKKSNSTRKAPVCQSTGTTVDLQQARLPKTPKQCPLMPSQQKAFCPAHPSTGPGKEDRDQGGRQSLIPGLEITSRVLLPVPPVTDTKNHKRPQSTKTPGAQRPGRSVGTVQTPNKPLKQETTLPAKTHKAPRLVTSSSDRPPSTVFQVSIEDNEDRETLGRLISPNALTCPLQGPSRDRNHKDVEIPGAPPEGQALGMKPSEDEGANTSSRRQETTETFGWEKDHQPPPCGQSRDQDVTAKGQCPHRNLWSTVEMAEDKMGGQGKAGNNNSPSKSTTSITAAASGLGQEQGPPAAAVFSEEAVPHGEGESTEIGAAKPAAEVNQQLHPTEQPPSLTTSSTATGLRIQDHVHGGNVMAESQNKHGTSTSPTSWGANGSKEQDSNVLIFSDKNPDEGTMIREQGPRESSLLPTNNPAPLDGAGIEAQQRRKIRLVIPERPSSGSNNTISRKIR